MNETIEKIQNTAEDLDDDDEMEEELMSPTAYTNEPSYLKLNFRRSMYQ